MIRELAFARIQGAICPCKISVQRDEEWKEDPSLAEKAA